MQYTPQPPHGQLVQNDPHFTLMADADGVGFIHCGDAVVVVPLTASGDVLLAVERPPPGTARSSPWSAAPSRPANRWRGPPFASSRRK